MIYSYLHVPRLAGCIRLLLIPGTRTAWKVEVDPSLTQYLIPIFRFITNDVEWDVSVGCEWSISCPDAGPSLLTTFDLGAIGLQKENSYLSECLIHRRELARIQFMGEQIYQQMHLIPIEKAQCHEGGMINKRRKYLTLIKRQGAHQSE